MIHQMQFEFYIENFIYELSDSLRSIAALTPSGFAPGTFIPLITNVGVELTPIACASSISALTLAAALSEATHALYFFVSTPNFLAYASKVSSAFLM